FFHCEWDPHVRRCADRRPEELARRDADDRVSHVVDRDRLTNRTRILAQSLSPPRMTDDGNRMVTLILIVRLTQHTTEMSVHAQNREIRTGHQLHLELFDVACAVVDEAMDRPLNTQHTREAGKHIVALLHLSIKRVREEV